MAQATLQVNKIGKNKFEAVLRFADGAVEPFPGDFPRKHKKLDGQTVEVEKVGNKIAKIQSGNDMLYFAFGLAASSNAGSSSVTHGSTPSGSARQGRQKLEKQVEQIKSPALAPYNFIPLNDNVFEISPQDIPSFDRYDGNRYTGSIALNIETVTPLYIRDTLNENELERDMKANENPNFFGPGGRLQIPGSSLRGMVRSLVEIVGFGKLEFVDDKNLYYRSFADVTTSLREDYTSKMTDSVQGAYSVQVQAGYLRNAGGNRYEIIPAQSTDNTTFYRVEERLLVQQNDAALYPEEMAVTGGISRRTGKPYQKPNPNYQFSTKPVHFKKDAPRKHGRQYYGKVTHIQRADGPLPSGWQEGTLVCTGWMQKKKRHWVVNAILPQKERGKSILKIDDMLLKSYKDDVNRNEKADLLIQLKNASGNTVPCFYITEDIVDDDTQKRREKVTSFGHTGLFRLAYDLSVSDHILPGELLVEFRLTEERLAAMREEFEEQGKLLTASVWQKILTTFEDWLKNPGRYRTSWKDRKAFEKSMKKAFPQHKIEKRELYERVIIRHAQVVDLAGAIFGNESVFAGRVFFEDALLEKGKRNEEVLMGAAHPKILSSPKPTTFQHYLVQTRDNNRSLNHYNTASARIRGNKLYWHKQSSDKDWKESNTAELRKHRSQYTKINPVRPKTTFTGSIRFENLSEIELGALLFVLELPEGCFHKLGMGKPLGLGSVKITPTLRLSQRTSNGNKPGRYADLFCEWNATPPAQKTITDFREAFEQKIGQWLNHSETLWQHERLQELEVMLNYKKGLERQLSTRYMSIDGKNEFKYRPVLPKPSAVRAIPSQKAKDSTPTQRVKKDGHTVKKNR